MEQKNEKKMKFNAFCLIFARNYIVNSKEK